MSNSNVLKLPTQQDIEQAKETSRRLSKYHDVDRVQMSIEDSNGNKESIVLPGIAMQLLLNILADISRGNPVSVIPHKTELTTQQAANMLNVSRPYLVKLLENGDIHHHKVGTHRRVYVKDVIEYKARIDSDRSNTLDKLAELSQEIGMEY